MFKNFNQQEMIDVRFGHKGAVLLSVGARRLFCVFLRGGDLKINLCQHQTVYSCVL